METLTSNDEQVVLCAPDSADPYAAAFADDADGDGLVVSRRQFFQEAPEVKAALESLTRPDLDVRACRESCEWVGSVWARYQEQPGLLDPFLEELVTPLIGAVRRAVHEQPTAAVRALPNLHLVSSLLYILTTVRGYKTVARLFPHEAADLEPCLAAAEAEAAEGRSESWSTLYCLTLWLGTALLTPFDLESIDSGGERGLSARLLELGLAGLRHTSRTREASAWMLAKYFTRPDVSSRRSLPRFFQWTRDAWASDGQGAAGEPPSSSVGLGFMRCGAMQAWNQTFKSAPRSVLKSVWLQLLELCIKGPAGQGDIDFKASSALRKLRVAVACRAGLVALPPRLAPWRYDRGARSLLVNFERATGIPTGQMFTSVDTGAGAAPFEPPARGHLGEVPEDAEDEDVEIPEQIEDVIDLLLTSLSDADTVVRWAAAKGIGRITNRLSRDYGDQVLESLLERCFSFRETDKAWHGGCLALAELTRRGLLLPERLSVVVPLVCQALHFEQVSGNHAVGQHVRDAACYVCWAFARAYAPDVLEPFVAGIASTLIQVAVFDREINCRRAAAAAVQEHVGRQGTFPNGIDVVTFADYWTLSARRGAYLEVAPKLAALGEGDGTYRRGLIDHLVDRKLAHQDLQIRLLAGQALARLASQPSEALARHVNESVLPRLLASALAEGGRAPAGAVQARHGAVLGVAALTEVMAEEVAEANRAAIRNLVPSLEKLRAYRGRGGEVVREAACGLLARVAAAESWAFKEATGARYLQTVDECARHTTDAIQVAAAEALRVLAAKRLSADAVGRCVETYLDGLRKADENVSARRGLILRLGALPASALGCKASKLIRALAQEVRGADLPGGKEHDDPQTRQYSVIALGRLCLELPASGEDLDIVVSALEAAMADYAADRRGDVGSWVRETAMEVIAALLEAQARPPGPALHGVETTTRLVGLLLQQAVEKIDRLRERAFGLLRRLCGGGLAAMSCLELAHRRVCHGESYRAEAGATAPGTPGAAWPPSGLEALASALGGLEAESGESPEPVLGDASGAAAMAEKCRADRSAAIFDALVPLLDEAEYRTPLVTGLVVSIGGITEYTAKGAKRALLAFLQEGGDEAGRPVAVGTELLRIFERVGVKDSDDEAKRLLSPLFVTVGVLLAQGCFPASLASTLGESAAFAVRTSRDISRLRASVSVFIGLLRWPGSGRRRAMDTLLQLLGYSFPTVRQATAQALYIRLIEEAGDFDLCSDDGGGSVVPLAVLAETQELISVTPWGTDNEQALTGALREVYTKLQLDLPTGGRSILAPKRPKERRSDAEADYADLVRQAHY